MTQLKIEDYVISCVDEFKEYMGIDTFPVFSTVTKEIDLEKSKQQGFDSVATAFYDVQTGTHKLEIWSQLYLPQFNAKYLIFHELTHILDAEVYSQKDKLKHMSNKGYTEYHAGQIDFMKLLGAENVNQPFVFKMDQRIETFGESKTALEFVDMPRELASELIGRADFPANIETLAVTLGLIFNYYGRRSICLMYAENYNDNADMGAIENFLGKDPVKALNKYMQGWFDAKKVALIDMLFGRMILSLVQKNKLS